MNSQFVTHKSEQINGGGGRQRKCKRKTKQYTNERKKKQTNRQTKSYSVLTPTNARTKKQTGSQHKNNKKNLQKWGDNTGYSSTIPGLLSAWILTPHQPHKVTSGRTNTILNNIFKN